MWIIFIVDRETGREWKEEYDNYQDYRKRLIKLNYSKKLMVSGVVRPLD